MSAPQSGSQNQTLLELIYAMKSLAQQVEFYHQDLSRRIDEEVRSHRNDIARIIDLNNNNFQTLSVLPVTLSDRVEKLLSRVESEMESQIKEVRTAVEEVQRALQEHARSTNLPTTHNSGTVPTPTLQDNKRDVTGRFEVTDAGDVRVSLNNKALKKIWYGVVVVAGGGGAYGFVELIKRWIGS